MATQAQGNVPGATGNLPSVGAPDNPQQIASGAIPFSLFSTPETEHTGASGTDPSTCTWCSSLGPLGLFVVALYVIDRWF